LSNECAPAADRNDTLPALALLLMKTGEKMTTEKQYRSISQRGASEAVYGLGVIGAWIYYISTAATFWAGALGIVKGVFWPAFLVYEWMKFLGM